MTNEEIKNLFPPQMRVINTTKENGEALLRGQTVTDSNGNQTTIGLNDVVAIPDDTDERLDTLETEVIAIGDQLDTVESIAKGANQAITYGNYQTMITAFNALSADAYNLGQNIMIITLNVPDLWVSEKAETSVAYNYVDDESFTNALKTNGYVQVGYYKLSALETQKVDLTEYMKKGEAPENMVTTNTEQVITGYKTFVSGIVISEGIAAIEDSGFAYFPWLSVGMDGPYTVEMYGDSGLSVYESAGGDELSLTPNKIMYRYDQSDGRGDYVFTFPRKSGTLAITDDCKKYYKHLIITPINMELGGKQVLSMMVTELSNQSTAYTFDERKVRVPGTSGIIINSRLIFANGEYYYGEGTFNSDGSIGFEAYNGTFKYTTISISNLNDYVSEL